NGGWMRPRRWAARPGSIRLTASQGFYDNCLIWRNTCNPSHSIAPASAAGEAPAPRLPTRALRQVGRYLETRLEAHRRAHQTRSHARRGARRKSAARLRRRGCSPSRTVAMGPIQCTSDLKRGPIEREVRRYADARGFAIIVNVLGLRAEESAGRAKRAIFSE